MKLTTHGPITLYTVVLAGNLNPILEIYEDNMYYYQYHKESGYYRVAARHQYDATPFGPWLNTAKTGLIFP